MNCLQAFRTKQKLASHIKVCENKDFCDVVMPSEDAKILEFDRYCISGKTTFIIYSDLESLIGQIDRYKNNPAILSTIKAHEHIPSGFSMSTTSLFKDIQDNCGV